MDAVTIDTISEHELTEQLRKQYIQNPPEGTTPHNIWHISDSDLLGMDFFLHEFDASEDDDFEEEGFYIF